MEKKLKSTSKPLFLAPSDLAFLIKIAKGVDDLTSLIAQINKRVYAMEEHRSDTLNKILDKISTEEASKLLPDIQGGSPVSINCTFDTPELLAAHQASLKWLEDAITVFVRDTGCRQFWVSFVKP